MGFLVTWQTQDGIVVGGPTEFDRFVTEPGEFYVKIAEGLERTFDVIAVVTTPSILGPGGPGRWDVRVTVRETPPTMWERLLCPSV